MNKVSRGVCNISVGERTIQQRVTRRVSFVTRLRKMMPKDLERRNYSDSTARGYFSAVAAFAQHCGKPPDQLGPEELRHYQAYRLKNRKLAVVTVVARVSALRFF